MPAEEKEKFNQKKTFRYFTRDMIMDEKYQKTKKH